MLNGRGGFEVRIVPFVGHRLHHIVFFPSDINVNLKRLVSTKVVNDSGNSPPTWGLLVFRPVPRSIALRKLTSLTLLEPWLVASWPRRSLLRSFKFWNVWFWSVSSQQNKRSETHEEQGVTNAKNRESTIGSTRKTRRTSISALMNESLRNTNHQAL